MALTKIGHENQSEVDVFETYDALSGHGLSCNRTSSTLVPIYMMFVRDV